MIEQCYKPFIEEYRTCVKKSFIFISALLLGCSSSPYDDESLSKFELKDVSSMWRIMRLNEPSVKSLPEAPYEGCVTLRFIINQEGKPDHIESIKAYPDNSMVEESISSFKGSLFKPGAENQAKKPIQSRVTFTFDNEARNGAPSIDIFRTSSITENCLEK